MAPTLGFSHMPASRHGTPPRRNLLTLPGLDRKMSAAASCTRLYRSASDLRFPGTFCVASACLCEAARTAEAFTSVCGRGGSVTEKAGCPVDVRTTMQTSCWRCQKVNFRVQILIETKIWTLTFCPLPKVRKRRECLGMIKTVNGIFQEYAERLLNECGFTKFAFLVLSAP